MTTKDLQTKYPSIYQTIYLEGYRATEKMLECPEEQQDKEKEVGVKAERARVKAVFEIGRKMPGHVALVERFMFDGKTTGDQAALAIVQAEGGRRTVIKSAN